MEDYFTKASNGGIRFDTPASESIGPDGSDN